MIAKPVTVMCLSCFTSIAKCRVMLKTNGGACCAGCSHGLTNTVDAATVPSSQALARRSPLSAALSTSTTQPNRESENGTQGPTSVLAPAAQDALRRAFSLPVELRGAAPFWPSGTARPPPHYQHRAILRGVASVMNDNVRALRDGWTEEGRDLLARVLRKTIERNRSSP